MDKYVVYTTQLGTPGIIRAGNVTACSGKDSENDAELKVCYLNELFKDRDRFPHGRPILSFVYDGDVEVTFRG